MPEQMKAKREVGRGWSPTRRMTAEELFTGSIIIFITAIVLFAIIALVGCG